MDLIVTTAELLRQPLSADVKNIARYLNNFARTDSLAKLRCPCRLFGTHARRPDREGNGAIGQIGYRLARPFRNHDIMTDANLPNSGVFDGIRASLAVQRRPGAVESGLCTPLCLARGE